MGVEARVRKLETESGDTGTKAEAEEGKSAQGGRESGPVLGTPLSGVAAGGERRWKYGNLILKPW